MSETTRLTNEYIEITKQDIEAHERTAKGQTNISVTRRRSIMADVSKALYVPKIFTGREERIFSDLVSTMCGIFYKVMDAYAKDEDYRRLFGFEPKLEELILREPTYDSPIPIARIDIFYNEETGDFKFCEFNTDGTSAMNEDRELNIAIQKTKAYQQMAETHEFKSFELFDSWVETFLEIYHSSQNPKEHPNVAIVDFMENATEMEFQIFCRAFQGTWMQGTAL